jgi:hypothetical protein
VDIGSIRRSRVSMRSVFLVSFIVFHAFVGVVFYIFYSFSTHIGLSSSNPLAWGKCFDK